MANLSQGVRRTLRFSNLAARETQKREEYAWNLPRNQDMDGVQGWDDWFYKSGAQRVDMDCDFLIIDSFNRHEFGTGVGREVNHPLNGLLAYDKRTTVSEDLWPDSYTPVHEFDHIPDKLPANYYLDATRAITRSVRPENDRHYVTNVQFLTMSQSKQKIDTWVWQDDTNGDWHEKIDKPTSGYVPDTLHPSNRFVTKAEFTGTWHQPEADFRLVIITGKGLGSLADIHISVNDLMDDYDAENDEVGNGNPNLLDNNTPVQSGISGGDTVLSFQMPTVNWRGDPVKPGLYSVQIKNNKSGASIFAPFVIRILPD